MQARRRLETLVRPHPSIAGGPERRVARLAAGLFLGLMALDLLALLLPQSGAGPVSGRRLAAGVLLGMGAGYALVRAGRVQAGVLAFIATVSGGLALAALSSPDHATALLLLAYLSVPIALAGILLPLRLALAALAATLVFGWLVESLVEDRLGDAPDAHAVTLGLLWLAVSAVAVLAAAITQRQARDLHEQTQLLGQLTDNLPEVLFVVAADGSRVLFTSPGYQGMTGRTVEQSLQDPFDWLKVVHPDDLARVRAELAAGKAVLDYRIVHAGTGEVKHVRARTVPVAGQDGRPVRLVGIVEDLTPIVAANEAVREAQRQRIQLLQQLAHDLASPLSPVKIHLRLLQDRVAESERKSLDVIRRNVEHVQRLVEDVKDVARLEGEGLRLDRKGTDLAALARAAVETLAPSAAERGVRLEVEAAGPCPAAIDAGRITQVLYNLVGNALKFTPPGGRVQVLVACGADAAVSVRDSGAGMAPDQVARLFKPFTQVHAPGTLRRPEDRGTGLGLYISKGIVEAHGGRIEAASEGPGRGSTFTFRLPLGAADDGRR